jgi:hypothetical protein
MKKLRLMMYLLTLFSLMANAFMADCIMSKPVYLGNNTDKGNLRGLRVRVWVAFLGPEKNPYP